MDPFSAATGGAGLISLGITICNGLLTYCGNYRSRRDDLAVLSQRTKELKEFVRPLEERQKDSTSTKDDVRSSLQECCSASTRCLQEIDIFNGKYLDRPQTASLKDHGSSVARKLQYPFQKDKLESLRRQIHEFHVALSSQVLLLNSDLTRDLHRLTLSESNSLHSVVVNEGKQLSAQVSSIVPDLQRTLDDNFSRIGQPLERRLENLEKLIVSSFQDLRDDCGEAEVTRPRTQKQAVERSRLLQDETLFGIECNCSPSNTKSHQATCFYSVRPLKKTNFTGKIVFFNLLFRWKIEAQYSPCAFPRDFQVYPNFTIRAVNPSSPAWEIVREISSPWEVPKDLPERCHKALRLLHQCFATGAAWPTDVDHEGSSLLYIACHDLTSLERENDVIIFLQFIKALTQMGIPINDSNHYSFTPLADFMAFGYPRVTDMKTLASRILTEELGAELRVRKGQPCSGFGGLGYLPLERRVASGIDTPLEYKTLSCAVLEESELRVQQLLSESRSYILETGPGGETPLHLAASWPRGLQLLLQVLGNNSLQDALEVKDDQGRTALTYALHLRQEDSIRLLVDAGAYIDLEDTRVMFHLEQNLLSFTITNTASTNKILRFLGRTLVDRRRRLSTIALKWLPPDTLASFHLEAQQIPQELAFEIALALKNHPMSEHWPHEPRPGSVYHTRCISASLAEALYQAGFDRTNIDFHGFTPLMTVDLSMRDYRRNRIFGVLDLVRWFVRHGADIYKTIPAACYNFESTQKIEGCSFKVVHRCAWWIGFNLSLRHNAMNEQKDSLCQQLAHWMQISGRSERDACECFCTGHGCSPVSLFVRGILRGCRIPSYLPRTSWRRLERQRISYCLLGVVVELFSHGQVAFQDLVTDVLRVLVFEALEMRHTCCKYDLSLPRDYNVGQAILEGSYCPVGLMDPDEVDEIRDEDRSLAALLDEFMAEVEEKLTRNGQSFGEFFNGYFKNKLIELSGHEGEKLSRDEVERIRDIGVVLEGS